MNKIVWITDDGRVWTERPAHMGAVKYIRFDIHEAKLKEKATP